MMNKKNIKDRIVITFLTFIALGLGSCEKYLDKAPESDISEKEVFGDFMSFQGFIEEMYHCIADPNRRIAGNRYYFPFFDDSIHANQPMLWDDGNYRADQWAWLTGVANTGRNVMNKNIWPLAWYAIRKANIALENLDLLQNATQEQRDAIEGQAYFFRAFFYLELMQYYGGLPYIDEVLLPGEPITVPRLSYRETADKVAEDFRRAIELLPTDWRAWDASSAGARTSGDNRLRASKIEALAYLGKHLLYAASPLMNESSGGPNAYDVELCKEAADAFAEVINLSQPYNANGVFELEPWDSRHQNFWVVSPNYSVRPGGNEVIRHQMIYDNNFTKFTMGRVGLLLVFPNSHNTVMVPTHNYVENYGMANGLPLDDPDSGFDPANPFDNRDPRFYIDITVGGDQIGLNTQIPLENRYARLHNGGSHKGGTGGSVTGYLLRKYQPLGYTTPLDGDWNNFMANIPRLRLADVYLMYAEAVLWGHGSATASAPNVSLTAEEAFNVIRQRADDMPGVHPKFLTSQQAFMEEIIRERAVELAYEGLRFFDLRRWNRFTELRYKERYAYDYDSNDNGFTKFNFRKRLIFTRVADARNNWVPFNENDVRNYSEFTQNPGW